MKADFNNLFLNVGDLLILVFLILAIFYAIHLCYYFKRRKVATVKVLWKLKAPLFLLVFIGIIFTGQHTGYWWQTTHGGFEPQIIYSPFSDLHSQVFYWTYVQYLSANQHNEINWDVDTILHTIINSTMMFFLILSFSGLILFGMNKAMEDE